MGTKVYSHEKIWVLVPLFILIVLISVDVYKRTDNLARLLLNNLAVDKGTFKRKLQLGLKKFFGYKLVWVALLIMFIFTSMIYKPTMFTSEIYRTSVTYTPDHQWDKDPSPSLKHPFGLTPRDLDLLMLLVYQTRSAFEIPLKSVAVSMVIGIMMGSIAGYFKGAVDNVLMWFVETILAFVPFMVLLVMVTIMNTTAVRILTYAVLGGSTLAKIVRSEMLSIGSREFTQAAKAMGCSEFEIIFKHLLKNCTSNILVHTTNFLAQVIIYESSLAFLGLGGVGWVQIMGDIFRLDGINAFRHYPWTAIYPGLFIFLLIASIFTIGESLRRALEVKEGA